MLNYILLMQIVGCFFVILGHSYPLVSDIPTAFVNFRSFVYFFHMPVFVFCSGYLLSFTKQVSKYSIGKFVKRRSKRLLIPYLIFSLIGILPKAFFGEYLNDNVSLDFNSLIRVFVIPRENIWGHFWFLPMIFFMGVIGYIVNFAIDKTKYKATLSGLILTAAFILSFVKLENGAVFGVNDLLNYFWYFVLGNLSAYIKFDNIRKKQLIGLFAIAFSVIFYLIYLKIGVPSDALTSKIIGVVMIFGLLLICMSCDGRITISQSSPLRQTYTVFILSWPCQLVSEIVTERFLNIRSFYFIFLIQFLVGLMVPIVFIKLIELFEQKTKTRFVSFALGK